MTGAQAARRRASSRSSLARPYIWRPPARALAGLLPGRPDLAQGSERQPEVLSHLRRLHACPKRSLDHLALRLRELTPVLPPTPRQIGPAWSLSGEGQRRFAH